MANKTVTVRPSGGTYTSLQAAITGEVAANANLTATGMDGILTISIEGTWSTPDTAEANVTGFTVDSTHYVNIVTDSANRAGTSWSTSKYRLNAPLIFDTTQYTRVTGLQIYGEYSYDFIQDNANSVLIDSCFIRTSNNTRSDVYLSGQYSVMQNCIVISGSESPACILIGNSTNEMRNCVITGCAGYGVNNSGGGLVVNCYSGDNTGADYYNTGTYTTSYSEDGTRSTPTAAYSTDTFENVTGSSEDYALVSGSDLIGEGTDLSADAMYPFDWDITGATRTTWDVGAYYFASTSAITGTGAIAGTAGTISASGTVGTPEVTGTGEVTGSLGVVEASGTAHPPEVTGDGTVTGAVGAVSGTGTYTSPVVSGDGTVTGTVGAVSGTGTYTTPEVTGYGDVTGVVGAVSGTGTYTPPVVSGDGDVTGDVGTIAGEGAVVLPVVMGTGAVMGTSGTVTGVGRFGTLVGEGFTATSAVGSTLFEATRTVDIGVEESCAVDGDLSFWRSYVIEYEYEATRICEAQIEATCEI